MKRWRWICAAAGGFLLGLAAGRPLPAPGDALRGAALRAVEAAPAGAPDVPVQMHEIALRGPAADRWTENIPGRPRAGTRVAGDPARANPLLQMRPSLPSGAGRGAAATARGAGGETESPSLGWLADAVLGEDAPAPAARGAREAPAVADARAAASAESASTPRAAARRRTGVESGQSGDAGWKGLTEALFGAGLEGGAAPDRRARGGLTPPPAADAAGAAGPDLPGIPDATGGEPGPRPRRSLRSGSAGQELLDF